MISSKDDIIKKQRSVYLLTLVIILLLLVLITWIVYHFKDENRFTVVKLFGETAAYNGSKNYGEVMFPASKKWKGALLAGENDLLFFENSFIYFNSERNDSLHVDEAGDSLVFVNGKINSILINDTTELLPWFKKMKVEDISGLESIFFSSIIPVNYIPYIKEIARLKPNLSLGFDSNDSPEIFDSYFKQTDFFAPRFVFASISQEQFGLLERWKSIESIFLEITDSAATTTLPAMPLLNQCIISGIEKNALSASFFSNNKQIKKITLLDYNEKKSALLLLLQPLNNLEEITINTTSDEMIDVAQLKNKFTDLSVLILSCNCKNIDLLAKCKNLNWLGLPKNTSQQSFNSIATVLKQLQVLEFKGNDSIINFSVLQQLPNLRGLVITDTVTDKKSLLALKDLRYLSVPSENEEDSTYLVSLEKALPGCIVVPNTGFCLGSGWLLLLLPLLLLFSFIYQKKLIKKVFDKTADIEIS